MRRYTSHALCLALAAGAVVACAGPAAGEAVFTDGTESSGTKDKDKKSSSSSSTSSSSGSSADKDKFFGLVKYEYDKNPPAQNADDHKDGTHTGKTPLAAQECVTAGCHADGVQPWAIAGTVFDSKTGTTGVPKVQVGILTPDNKITETYTDAQGHFWLELAAPPPAGSKVAVRKASGSPSQAMATPLPAPPGGGNCNNATGCHGATNRIYVE